MIAVDAYVDSGAARSVCPESHASQFAVHPTAASKRGEGFKTATNKRVRNLGSRTVLGLDAHGKAVSMNYSVANISAALDSVSQVCDAGSTVVFKKSGGYIESSNGRRIPLARIGDTYFRATWVRNGPVEVETPVFSRPSQQGS